MWLIRPSLIRGGLVSPLILIRRTSSNNISPIDLGRRVFGFLDMGNLSMEGFVCGPKVHLHKNGSSDMLHIKVGNSNALNNGRDKGVIFGRKVIEKDHSAEGFWEIKTSLHHLVEE